LFIISCTISGMTTTSNQYDNFAKCLTDKGVKMYGAYWCSHCNNEKALFGESFQYVDYTECSLPDNSGQTQVCLNANIDSYPTWEFKDGSRIKGEMTFLQLSQKSGCSLS
ncbi:MAG: hypothetical protein AABX25_01385, partial [Nanoarchaeota archaeon]